MDSNELISELGRVLERFDVKLAILFGSHAHGEGGYLSDVDVLVDGSFSDSEVILEISRALNIPIEKVDLVRSNELPMKVLAKVLKEGLVILCRDVDHLNELIDRVVVNYIDAVESLHIDPKDLLNPNTGVDVARVIDLMNNILGKGKVLKELLSRYTLEDFERDFFLDPALRWLIYEIVQSMIDICAHAASRLRLATVEAYRDYIASLMDNRIMDRGLGLKLIEYISLGNRLAHRYRYVTTRELIESASKLGEELIPAFTNWVRKVLTSSAAEA